MTPNVLRNTRHGILKYCYSDVGATPTAQENLNFSTLSNLTTSVELSPVPMQITGW